MGCRCCRRCCCWHARVSRVAGAAGAGAAAAAAASVAAVAPAAAAAAALQSPARSSCGPSRATCPTRPPPHPPAPSTEFCKQQLWPILHYLVPLSPASLGRFDPALWSAYVRANMAFANKLVEVGAAASSGRRKARVPAGALSATRPSPPSWWRRGSAGGVLDRSARAAGSQRAGALGACGSRPCRLRIHRGAGSLDSARRAHPTGAPALLRRCWARWRTTLCGSTTITCWCCPPCCASASTASSARARAPPGRAPAGRLGLLVQGPPRVPAPAPCCTRVSLAVDRSQNHNL